MDVYSEKNSNWTWGSGVRFTRSIHYVWIALNVSVFTALEAEKPKEETE